MMITTELGKLIDVMRNPSQWKGQVKGGLLTFTKRPVKWEGTFEEFLRQGGCEVCESLPPGAHSKGSMICPRGRR